MSAIITSTARINNSKRLIESFSGTERQYLFVGRPQPWIDENNPPAPFDSLKNENQVRSDILAFKRLNPTEVTHGIPRINWVSGNYYDFYRHDYDGTKAGVDLTSGSATLPLDLFGANFYVVTDEFKVYKCLWNNGGQPSTVKPSTTGINEVTLADGYIWKYMYTVSPADTLKFVTRDFIPVKKLEADPGSTDPYYDQFLIQQSAVNGSINFIRVDSSGSGYPVSSNAIPVTIIGDGTGATALATTNSLGQVIRITMSNKGTGYTFATATIGGGGTGATATAIISPKGGHGSDAVYELGAYYALVSVNLGFEEGGGDFPKFNDYRRLGIMSKPNIFDTTTPAFANTLDATAKLQLTSVSSGVGGFYRVDEVIQGSTSGATAIVVEYDEVTSTLKYIQPKNQEAFFFGNFVPGETISGTTSGASGSLQIKINPEVDTYSGDMVYLENRAVVTRSSDQTEEIRIVIET